MPRDPNSRYHPYLVLGLVSFGVFVAADDLTVVSTLLPQMIFDFEIPLPSGLDDAAWIVSAYLIAYIVAMPFLGRVSDIYGRLRVYLASLGLFAFGSIFVPLVDNFWLLVVFRAVQALGGGAMVPVAMAIVGDLFEESRRAVAMGVLVAVDTAGWIFGPLYGAFLVRYLNWRWQFYLNIPASLIAAATAYWALRQVPQPRQRQSLDIPGAVLFMGGLLALNVALSYSGGRAATGPTFDFDAPPPATQWVVPLLAVSAVLFGLFVALERRVKQPLIDVRMLRRRNFALACAVNFAVGVALIIAMVDVPLFINSMAEGITADEWLRNAAVQSGQVLAVLTGTMSVASLVGGWLCGKVGYRIPMAAGLLCASGGLGLMGTWGPGTPFGPMAGHVILVGLGFGLVTSPLGTAVIDAVGETQRGIASGLVVILRLIGMSVGLSLLTAWGLHRFEQLSSQYSVVQLAGVIVDLTAQVLDETFLVAGGVLVLAIPLALAVRHRVRPGRNEGQSPSKGGEATQS